jgi:hypothetical protein
VPSPIRILERTCHVRQPHVHLGTTITFDITEVDGGTQVRFTHVGLVPEFECYDVCSDAWGGLISTDRPT